MSSSGENRCGMGLDDGTFCDAFRDCELPLDRLRSLKAGLFPYCDDKGVKTVDCWNPINGVDSISGENPASKAAEGNGVGGKAPKPGGGNGAPADASNPN